MSSTESPVPSIDDDELCSDACSVVENASQHDDSVNEIFSASEIALYSKRKEEGYDLKNDLRYNLWLSLQSGSPLDTEVLKLPYHSVASKIIGSVPPPIKKPRLTPKSCARVITSIECRKEINEKEERRVETLRLKEERKAERMKKQEEKKRLQEEKKRLQEEKKRLQEEKKRLQEEKRNSKAFNHASRYNLLIRTFRYY